VHVRRGAALPDGTREGVLPGDLFRAKRSIPSTYARAERVNDFETPGVMKLVSSWA
jgi:hypothetical protein